MVKKKKKKNPPTSARDARQAGSTHSLEDSPVQRNDTHSSVLAWKIPWAEEPDRPQSMGSQRVGHD